ncbi:hypothetical protein, partial [Dokdonella sp.]|uniref:hypothetical protein n=1 Tax=Dokdonella sp. TaxID=2291710 RepID=UPI002DD6534E
IRGVPPPPAFVLCVRGEDFGLGKDLSAAARQHFDAAAARLAACLTRPDAAYWRRLAEADRRVVTT